MWICKHCKTEFDFTKTSEKGNHSRHCDKNPNKRRSYVGISKALSLKYDKELGKFEQFIVNCHLCDKEFPIVERSKYFSKDSRYYCSRSCANSLGGRAKTENTIMMV